jgi:DNA repair exonuclease SbcCD ATPase subunit
MPSASDIYDQLIKANQNLVAIEGKLDTLKGSTDAVRTAVEQVETILNNGLPQLIALNEYMAQALHENDLQNGTMICILEKIAKNTCDLVNQSHLQTALQSNIGKNTAGLAEMYATTHAEAALGREREERLRRDMEKCCPPEPPVPPCQDQPCPAPKPIGPPPSVRVVIE